MMGVTSVDVCRHARGLEVTRITATGMREVCRHARGLEVKSTNEVTQVNVCRHARGLEECF